MKLGPVRHKVFSAELVGRVRLVRAALLDVDLHSMDYWLDGFRHDSHPSQEVGLWERAAAVYLEYLAMTPELTRAQRALVFKAVVFCLAAAEPSEKELAKLVESLPSDALPKLLALYDSSLPAYDIREKLAFGRKGGKRGKNEDREAFPADPPERPVRRVMRPAQTK